jgi:hypothetical protein
MIIRLLYFKKSQTGICADDFKNKEKVDIINLEYLLSVSDLESFMTPFTGRYVGKFAIVKMSNNDTYYIGGASFRYLSEELAKKNQPENPSCLGDGILTPFGESIKLLRDLADLQNDAPLEKHRKEWEETMQNVYNFLNTWESQPPHEPTI